MDAAFVARLIVVAVALLPVFAAVCWHCECTRAWTRRKWLGEGGDREGEECSPLLEAAGSAEPGRASRHAGNAAANPAPAAAPAAARAPTRPAAQQQIVEAERRRPGQAVRVWGRAKGHVASGTK